MNRDKNQPEDRQDEQAQKPQHSSAFREPNPRDEKSTTNIEEEARLEQERKEAMTERD